LLAQPTGDEDHPYQAVILKSHTGADALSLEDLCATPLRIEDLKGNVTDEELRTRLAAALIAYKAEHGANPDFVSLPEVAVFQVFNSAPARGHDVRLAGRVSVVTGAAGAIGYGICTGLLEHGAHVAITDLPGEKLDQFVAEFQTRDPVRTFGVPMDVTDPASVASTFAQIIAHWGGVDIVVLNAGIALTSPLIEMDLEAFRRLERVNTEGTLLVLAEAGRQFARQHLGGDMVLISTKNVYAPGAGFGAYSATKAAAHQLARIASLEFAPLGVRVNMVSPDAVFSGGTHKSGLWAEVGPGSMKRAWRITIANAIS
jgi:NAD(P)-dependent dehydrogenase (short-subunit alcohol dehydrogenase family)